MSREGGVRAVAAALLLTGCASSPYHLPDAPDVVLPQHFERASAAGVAQPDLGTAREPGSDAKVLAGWWEMLHSPELDALVDRAIANNPDLRIANFQVQEAALRRDGAEVAGMPEITLPVTQAAQYPNGQVPGVPTPPGSGGVQLSLQTNLQASWRPDVWGEQKASRLSVAFQLARAVHQREDVQRNLVAAVIVQYIDYLAINDAIQAAKAQIRTSTRLLANVRMALDAHDAVLEDVERNRAALAALEVGLPALELQRDQDASALAFLVGAGVGDLELPEHGLDSLDLPDAGLPLNTRLLLQRPDVRMMESRMLAARADLAAAHARLLPPVSFSAGSGFSGVGLSHLLQPQLFFWNAVASITPVIFDGGRRAIEESGDHAIFEEMVGTYMRTIQSAAREVEDALAGVRTKHAQLEAQRVSEQATHNILDLNLDAYRSGAVSTATVLEAQRVWQQSHADQLRNRGEFIKAYAVLFQALGAGSPREDFRPAPRVSLALDGPNFGDPLPVNVPAGSWRVELPGVYPPAAVPAVWRDLRARFAARPAGLGLRADRSGILQPDAAGSEQWFRLSLVNFDDRASAEHFCDALRHQQQLCSAVQGKTGKS